MLLNQQRIKRGHQNLQKPRKFAKILLTAHCRTNAEQIDGQIEQYHNANIPIFISEYSVARNGQTQTFEEFKALFSPEMMKIFSGGCVYEMWHGPNQYGLAQMVAPGSSEVDSKSIREQRETQIGTLLLYEDFGNYKAALAATQEVQRVVSPDIVGRDEEVRTGEGHQDQKQQVLDIPGAIPESCVDWDAI